MLDNMNNLVNQMKEAADPVSSQVALIEYGLSNQIASRSISLEELAGICRRLGLTVLTEEEFANLEGAAHFASMGGGYPENN
jgi:hypothetical protein